MEFQSRGDAEAWLEWIKKKSQINTLETGSADNFLKEFSMKEKRNWTAVGRCSKVKRILLVAVFVR